MPSTANHRIATMVIAQTVATNAVKAIHGSRRTHRPIRRTRQVSPLERGPAISLAVGLRYFVMSARGVSCFQSPPSPTEESNDTSEKPLFASYFPVESDANFVLTNWPPMSPKLLTVFV